MSGNPVSYDGSVFAYAVMSSVSGDYRSAKIYSFDASSGKAEWTFRFTGFSGQPSPAVGDGVIDVAGLHWLYALSAATGTVLWRHAIKSDLGTGPAAAGSSVYFADNDRLYALAAGSGKTMWSTELPRGVSGEPDVGTTGNIVSDFAANGVLYGFSELNGHLRWSRNTNSSRTGPGVTLTGADIWFVTNSGMLGAVDSLNGQIVWDSPAAEADTTPVETGNTVYVGTEYGTIDAMNARTGETKWTSASAALPIGLPFVVSVGVGRGTVYAETYSTIYALNAATGKIRWAYQTGPLDVPDDAGPIAAIGGSIYLGMGGIVLALRGESTEQ